MRQRVVGNQVIERADDVRDGLHAVVEQEGARLGVDEGLEPLERVVVEVVVLLQNPPRHVGRLQRLRHSLPLQALAFVVIQMAESRHGCVVGRGNVAVAVPAAKEELAVGVGGSLRALEVLVADSPRISHCVIEREIGSVEVSHAKTWLPGRVPPVSPSPVDDAHVAGIRHFRRGHACRSGLVEREVKGQQVLVDGVEAAVERLLEGGGAVLQRWGCAVVEASHLRDQNVTRYKRDRGCGNIRRQGCRSSGRTLGFPA